MYVLDSQIHRGIIFLKRTDCVLSSFVNRQQCSARFDLHIWKLSAQKYYLLEFVTRMNGERGFILNT